MSKTFPTKITTFIVADSLRQEDNGKVMIIGMYSAGLINFLETTTTFPAAIPLGLLVVFGDGEGLFTAKIRVSDPDNNPMGALITLGNIEKVPLQPMQLLINMPIMIMPKIGKYQIDIFLDDKVYSDSFTVAVGMPKGVTKVPS